MGFTIVVLAAGLGTRYGSLKQLAPLGPRGEALLDYTLFDASRAGFSEAVIVVRQGITAEMDAHFATFVPPLTVRLVAQDAFPPRRATPWGTAHATLVGGADCVTPFAVANADDAYGPEAIAAIARALARARDDRTTAVVAGYAAGTTLSRTGGVSRAVCRVGAGDRLLAIEEHTGVHAEGDALTSDQGARFPRSTLVSMNLWGFDPSFLEPLRGAVDRFVAAHTGDDRELRLPDVVGELAVAGTIDATVVPTASTWLGVTHLDDAPAVRDQLAVYAAAGTYPDPLMAAR